MNARGLAALLSMLAVAQPAEDFLEADLDEVFPPRRPGDEVERDAVWRSGKTLCVSRHAVGFRCTRTLGHLDDHAAANERGEVLARWHPKV